MQPKMTKRQFLETFFRGVAGALLFHAPTSRARALGILENMEQAIPNPIQDKILSDPPRRTLLAETAACVGLTGAAKLKCNSM